MIVKRNKTIEQSDIDKVVKLLKAETLSGFNAGPGERFYGGKNVKALEKDSIIKLLLLLKNIKI